MNETLTVFDNALAAAKFRASQPGSDPELDTLCRAAERLRDDLVDLEHLFELQRKRVEEAQQRWRDEDPDNRALTIPDLGRLLQWLMDQADSAHREA